MNTKELFGVFARGVCMGIADLIPGVSGGTIAFISGIYRRLLSALAVFSTAAFWRAALRFDIRAAFKMADGVFIVALFAGILAAIALFSRLLHGWLESAPHLLLAFFFGLVLASGVALFRRGGANFTAVHAAYFLLSGGVTLFLVSLDALTIQHITLPALFFGGMVAICAMVLPGISGSYLLLVLGLYPAIITAVSERDFLTLAVVAAGCGAGLLMFARLLSALLARFYAAMLAVLLGVMFGAMPKLWPWKEQAEGAKIILQKNVLPAQYAGDADVGIALALIACGAISVLLIDRLDRRKK